MRLSATTITRTKHIKKLLILAASLLFISTSVFAGWSEIGSPSSGRFKVYVDYNSIFKDKNTITFWTLTDWKEIKESSGDKRLSDLQHIKLDCKRRTMTLLDFTWHSKNMGLGSLVYSRSNIKSEPVSVAPMTIDEVVLNKLCIK
jgi:hypothetical protein